MRAWRPARRSRTRGPERADTDPRDGSESAYQAAAQRAAEVAEAANRVAEGVRHELAAQRAHADLTRSEDRWSAEAPGGERTVVAAEEVMAHARELQASAERLSRTLADSRQPTPSASRARTAATQPRGEDDRRPEVESTMVSEGLRILIRQLAIETEDREEIAARLRSQYGVADARAVVDSVLDIDASGQDAI